MGVLLSRELGAVGDRVVIGLDLGRRMCRSSSKCLRNTRNPKAMTGRLLDVLYLPAFQEPLEVNDRYPVLYTRQCNVKEPAVYH
jgi:hypothetical protein